VPMPGPGSSPRAPGALVAPPAAPMRRL
jgi:hypothetical protein